MYRLKIQQFVRNVTNSFKSQIPAVTHFGDYQSYVFPRCIITCNYGSISSWNANSSQDYSFLSMLGMLGAFSAIDDDEEQQQVNYFLESIDDEDNQGDDHAKKKEKNIQKKK
eukprot:150760_1